MMKPPISLVYFVLLLIFFRCKEHSGSISPLIIGDLRVNYMHEPLGIDDERPAFSWKLSSLERGKYQLMYQILVASSQENLETDNGDWWDSGRVKDGRSVWIKYNGIKLESGRRYYWKVKIWDDQGRPTLFSEESWFETAKIEPGDWNARWISQRADSAGMPRLLPAPYFRKEFEIPEGKGILMARLYISGLGYYKAFINGQKIGDHVLDPVFTRYDRRVKYVVYDIGELIRPGKNCIGAVLGNGWYNQHTRSAWNLDSAVWRDDPSLLVQVEITMSDGSRKIISTDHSWKTGHGPIVFDGIRNGEHYDAKREIPGWNEVGFDDSVWTEAFQVKGPAGILSAQVMPPVRSIREVDPVKILEPKDRIFVVDFGENITGRVRISMKGETGQEIALRYGERVHPDGTLDQKELARFIWTGETQTDRYVFKGGEKEIWESSFVYHGFQYVQLEGLDHLPEKEEIRAVVLHTDLIPAGTFQCSNEMFNRLQHNLLNSFLGNFHGYPTDCPHREKIGWSGDAQLVSVTGLYNFELIPAYLKWMDDFADEQRPDGKVPAIIPTSGWGYQFGRGPRREYGYGPHWDGAYLNIPWDMYQFTGDTGILERYFEGWRSYMDYLERSATEYILDYGIDDHKPAFTVTEGDILSTAYFYDFSRKMSHIAGKLGRMQDKEHFDQLAAKIFQAFNDRFFDNDKGIYGNGGQTPMSLALFLNLVPEDEKDRVTGNLLEEIRNKNYHIDAGVVGTRMMIKTLTRLSYPEIMYRIVSQHDYPGWGYWVNRGASTLWQTWEGDMSLNHIMFGSIGEWFYEVPGGIRSDLENPGFRKFILKPEATDSLEWVKCQYESLYGTITSNWERKKDHFAWEVEVPVNTTALLYLPVKYGKEKYESGKKLGNTSFIKILDKNNRNWLMEVASGKYFFEVK